MKNMLLVRHFGTKPLAGKRGEERALLQLVDNAPEPTGKEQLTKIEQFRTPCIDAVHRFGKTHGSTNK